VKNSLKSILQKKNDLTCFAAEEKKSHISYNHGMGKHIFQTMILCNFKWTISDKMVWSGLEKTNADSSFRLPTGIKAVKYFQGFFKKLRHTSLIDENSKLIMEECDRQISSLRFLLGPLFYRSTQMSYGKPRNNTKSRK